MDVLDKEREFICLLEGLRDTLYRLARSIVLSDAEAQDVTQDLFERAWRARDAVLASAYPRAYLCRMARNLAIDYWRQRRRHRELEAQSISVNLLDEERRMEASDMAALTQKIIDHLPEKQRIVVHLRDVEEYEISEIAEVMECDEVSVRMNLSRARKSVREQLLTYMSYGVK